MGRLQAAWRGLDRDQRLAAFAALALLATMFLPWYETKVFNTRSGAFASDTDSAFTSGPTFIEAAIFLVAIGVLLLLLARGERRGFHLPGGDGTVIFGAGVWAALLLLWRVFDRPEAEGQGATVGISWGFFFAFVAAAAVAAIGWRIRVAGRPEPPLPTEVEPEPRTAATEVVPRRRRPRAGGPIKNPDPASGSVSLSQEKTRQLRLDEHEPPTDATHDLDDPDPLRPGEIPRAPDR